MKTPALHHLVLALVAVILLSAAYTFWLFETRKAEETTHALSSEIAVATGDHREAGTARSVLAEVEAEEAFVNARFVPTTDIVPFLERLESLGSAFGADVAVLSVGDPAADGTLTLSLSLSGSFDAVMRTLGLIEEGSYASTVRSVTLDGNGEGVWNASVSAIVLTTSSP